MHYAKSKIDVHRVEVRLVDLCAHSCAFFTKQSHIHYDRVLEHCNIGSQIILHPLIKCLLSFASNVVYLGADSIKVPPPNYPRNR